MYKTYNKKFIEPSINSWVFESNEKIISPVKNQYLNINKLDWNKIESSSQSEILWLYSLGALVKARLEDKNLDITLQLKSFLDFQESEENIQLYNPSINHSFDHCTAVRIRYLCILLSNTNKNIDLIHRIIRNDLTWFDSLDNLPMNNHGMMVCISIFHVSIFVRDDRNERLIQKASQFLIKILESVIPDNYYVVENTIGYHEFYVKTLKSVLEFVGEYHINHDLIIYLSDLNEKLENTLYQVVYPSGGLPPIGQCGSYQTKYKSLPGTYLFEPQGFWVKKDDKNYISFICGHASTVHKQVDDLSVLLKLSDQDIFLDCGLGTYDHRDNKARIINGQRGHSGAFFKKFDTWTMWEYFSSKKLRESETEIKANNERIFGVKKLTFENIQYEISRDLLFRSYYDFTITDSFSSQELYAAQPVSRFILPGYVDIEREKGVIRLIYPKYLVSISVEEDFYMSVIPSYNRNNYLSSAYYSTAYAKYHEALTLEIYPIADKLTMKVLVKDLDV